MFPRSVRVCHRVLRQNRSTPSCRCVYCMSSSSSADLAPYNASQGYCGLQIETSTNASCTKKLFNPSFWTLVSPSMASRTVEPMKLRPHPLAPAQWPRRTVRQGARRRHQSNLRFDNAQEPSLPLRDKKKAVQSLVQIVGIHWTENEGIKTEALPLVARLRPSRAARKSVTNGYAASTVWIQSPAPPQALSRSSTLQPRSPLQTPLNSNTSSRLQS